MRAARWVVVLASALFALVAAWELFGPLEGGHWAAMAAEGIAGENMLRLHVFGPITHYVAEKPVPFDYYCHHPYGLFILQAIARAIFGHHPATVRLVAVFCSALTPPLVYVLANELWDDARVAAVAAVAFVLLPIDLSFAGFAGLEVPTILFGLLFSWATARLWRTKDRRLVAVAFVGAVGTTQMDWPGIVLVGGLVGIVLLGSLVYPREAYGDLRKERLVRTWAWAALGAAALCIVLYVALLVSRGQVREILDSYRYRSQGAIAGPSEVFGPRRRMWLSWMFTPAGLGLLALSLPVTFARLRRHPLECIPVAWLLTASVQYFVFRSGADVHIFWPHYFAVSVALGLGALVAAALRAGAPRVASAAIAVVPLLIFARVGFPMAWQARVTSGRFDEKGLFIDAEADASEFARWATHDVPPEAVLSKTRHGFPRDMQVEYSVGAIVPTVVSSTDPRKPGARDRIVVLDARRTPTKDLLAYAHAYDVEAAGPFWRLDRAGHGDFEALRYVEREPASFERYFITGTDLLRSIAADLDPWATWEWRTHLGLAAPEPTTEPSTDDDLRIAHNLAVVHGDTAKAAALLARVTRGIPGDARADFDGDVHLLGVNVAPGPAPVATLWWLAGPDYTPVDASFAVTCKVIAAPALWPAALDFYEKKMAPGMTLAPPLWRPGFLYAQRFIVRHRVGTEQCEGSFSAASLGDTRGRTRVPLFTMP